MPAMIPGERPLLELDLVPVSLAARGVVGTDDAVLLLMT